MPRPTVSVTATVELTVAANIRQMLKTRLEEYTRIAAEIKERKGRQERIQREVGELFTQAGQDAALAAGTYVDGIKVKRVGGTTRTLDKMALMKALDLTAEELDAFYDEKPKKAFIKITAPGEKDED